MIDKLKRIKSLTDSILKDIENVPEKAAISNLLKALQLIEDYYKSWCREHDDDTGDAPGTTYKNGTFIEFYIESDWWHDVSKELRKWKINE